MRDYFVRAATLVTPALEYRVVVVVVLSLPAAASLEFIGAPDEKRAALSLERERELPIYDRRLPAARATCM